MDRGIFTVTVDGLWRQGTNNLAVRLVPHPGETLPEWQPGAHIDLHLPGGIIRQYSLTGSHTRADSYLICVAQERDSRGGSRYIHQSLRPGQTLSVSSPRNLFQLQHARHVTLLAAGIGITPLYAMALQRRAQDAPFTLHYFIKRRENAAFIQELARQLPADSVVIHCASEGVSQRGNLADVLRQGDLDSHHLYLCGPAGFMADGRQAALALGWDEALIHSEAFQPVALTRETVPANTFTVTISSSGEKWPVPADKTIAQVLQENGVEVALSCEMGMCGACLTPVIEGQVDHRDSVQSESEKQAACQYIALCCSRSHSDNLLIEL